MPYYIEEVSKLGKRISVTKRYWEYIVSKHESVESLEEKVKETLRKPETVRLSKEDPDVYLYYSRHGKYYLCVVCKHTDSGGFIITAYLADKIKKGRRVL